MVLVVNTMSFTCWNAFLLIMPVLGHERGLSATLIGAIFGAFSVTAAVSRPLLPRLMRKVPRRWLLIGTNLGCALIFASLVWVEAGWAYLLCASLLGLTLGSVQVLLLTNLSDESPADKQGEAMGLRMMTYSATSVVMPIAFGVVGALLGQAVVLLITAGVAAAAAALSTRLEQGRVDPP
jgi:MFS family permease